MSDLYEDADATGTYPTAFVAVSGAPKFMQNDREEGMCFVMSLPP